MQTGVDYPLAAGGDLQLQQTAQEVRVEPVVGGGLLDDGVELSVGRSGANLQKAVLGELFVRDSSRALSGASAGAESSPRASSPLHPLEPSTGGVGGAGTGGQLSVEQFVALAESLAPTLA